MTKEEYEVLQMNLQQSGKSVAMKIIVNGDIWTVKKEGLLLQA